jgi:hypothetical protein
MPRKYINHIKTPQSLTVIFDTGDPVTVPIESRAYADIENLIEAGQYSKIESAAVVKAKVESVIGGGFDVRNNQVFLKGEALPKVLSDRMIQFVNRELPIGPLMEFWLNCKANPYPESVVELYAFLEKNHVPITSDGCFVGYKGVQGDYKDRHTGKFDNSPGRIVQMERNKVDSNRNVHCGTGLHVGSFKYADSFKGSGGRLMEVKVNPRDVVSVPNDGNEKIRCCQYEVIRECSRYRKEQTYSGSNAQRTKKDKIGKTSTRIFTPSLKAAQIDDYTQYELSLSKGNLIIKLPE